jgi:hypothetical protein
VAPVTRTVLGVRGVLLVSVMVAPYRPQAIRSGQRSGRLLLA